MELFSFPFKAMGSPCELRLYSENKSTAKNVADACIAEVLRLEQKYSRYREDSVTTKINNTAGSKSGIDVDDETALLLTYAQVGYEQSDGLFDITSGILRKVWDFRSNKLPAQNDIDALLPLIGWDQLTWDSPHLVLPRKGMQLDFGGYVKEYAADVAANVSREKGVHHGMVNLGGDICIIGPHPNGDAWKVGIRNPRNPEQAISFVLLPKGGLASSGDYERFMFVEGMRYAHILNPKTGWPVNSLAGTSICADQCIVAGTSSTIAMLKGEQAGIAWLEQLGLPYFCMNQKQQVFGTIKPV